jgi:hypothetical protein
MTQVRNHHSHVPNVENSTQDFRTLRVTHSNSSPLKRRSEDYDLNAENKRLKESENEGNTTSRNSCVKVQRSMILLLFHSRLFGWLTEGDKAELSPLGF